MKSVVVEQAEVIAARLKDENVGAWLNASIVLNRTGESGPGAIRAQPSRLEVALSNASPDVHGNAYVGVPVEQLRALAREDLNEIVREQARWAMRRLS